MHIPENYLSPQTCGVMAAAMIPVWGVCIRKVKTELPKEKIALMGVGAAFSFISMMSTSRFREERRGMQWAAR